MTKWNKRLHWKLKYMLMSKDLNDEKYIINIQTLYICLEIKFTMQKTYKINLFFFYFKGNVSIVCPPGSSPCADALKCVAIDLFCDGELNCPDGSDEDNNTCGK